MQNTASNVATFSHSPGQMAWVKDHDLQQGQGTMLQGQGLSGFFRSSTGIQGKISEKERSEGITAQKSITRFLGCYKPSPLKGISSSRFVGVAQNYTHSFSKISGLGKTMHGCIETETRISQDRLHYQGSPFLERRAIHFSNKANVTLMNSGSSC